MAIDHYNNNGLAESADVAVAVEKTMEYRSSNSLECDASGWYLPSIKELCLLYKGNTNIWTAANNVAEEINASIEKVGGATVLTGDYWSSTEAGTGSAHRIEASGKGHRHKNVQFLQGPSGDGVLKFMHKIFML